MEEAAKRRHEKMEYTQRIIFGRKNSPKQIADMLNILHRLYFRVHE
jgi:hypothetical protein